MDNIEMDAARELVERGEFGEHEIDLAFSFVKQARAYILAYINADVLPDELFYAMVSVALDFAKGSVTEIYEGDTKVKYFDENLAGKYRGQLNKFRRIHKRDE